MSVVGTARLHHVQLAIPAGGEDAARAFWCDVLGFAEVPKPSRLAARGGCWFRAGRTELHLGVEEPFSPARKAHPGVLVDDLDAVASALAAAGHEPRHDDAFPGLDRFYVDDPFGNRLEFLAHRPADVTIRFPQPHDKQEVRAAAAELAAHGVEFALGLADADDFSQWCDRVRAQARGEQLPDGWVPATGLVAELDGRVVGRVHVRHELTPFLRDVGGHIGYGVRPEWRGRGVAGALLAAGLRVAAEQGIAEALVTCDDGNRASAAVIERAGGRLVGVTIIEEDGVHKRRYLVPTAPATAATDATRDVSDRAGD